MGNEEPEDLDTEQCITCGNPLAQSWCDKECFACIARGEDLQNEADDAEEGRDAMEAEPEPGFYTKYAIALRGPHEGGEYHRLANGVELMEGDIYDTGLESEGLDFRAIGWPRKYQTKSNWDIYWRPVEVEAGIHTDDETVDTNNVTIPKYLAKYALTELSPQWHTKAVRELLRTIEEQL